MRFAWSLLLAIVCISSAQAATPELDREFISACTQAFDRSSGNGAAGVGHQICECTAKESKHEGVSRAALKRETARIKADHKYKIQDHKLLNALHYCAIQTLHDT